MHELHSRYILGLCHISCHALPSTPRPGCLECPCDVDGNPNWLPVRLSRSSRWRDASPCGNSVVLWSPEQAFQLVAANPPTGGEASTGGGECLPASFTDGALLALHLPRSTEVRGLGEWKAGELWQSGPELGPHHGGMGCGRGCRAFVQGLCNCPVLGLG